MSEPTPQPPLERGLDRLDDVHSRLCRIEDELAIARVPAELASFAFNGKANITQQMDDVGAPGISYAIYNPTKFKVFVAMKGGPARPGSGALEVPAKFLVVFPFAVSGHIALGLDPEELKEEAALIFRARFHTVQPFAAHPLS